MSTNLSRRQFLEEFDAAEAASLSGPVFIMEGSEPRSVLIDIADYRRMNNSPMPSPEYRPGSVAALFAKMPQFAELDDVEIPFLHDFSVPMDFD